MSYNLLSIGLLLAGVGTLAGQPAKDWQAVFAVDKKTLGVKGANPYFNLTPGYTLSYRHGKDTDTLTVLNETRLIDGVETRAVEDREMKDGRLIELTRDYYAIDSVTNDVYYFGEDVDVYKNGKVTGHEGTWLSGVKGAKFGLMMARRSQTGSEILSGAGARRRHGPCRDCLRHRKDRHAGRGVRKLRPRSGKQPDRKRAARSQMVCARRGPGEGRRDGVGQVRKRYMR